MDATNQQKLLNAGFTIIRADEANLKIKCKTSGQREWHNIPNDPIYFTPLQYPPKSKASLRRAMDSLLELDFMVED